jgi:hypothetical protein
MFMDTSDASFGQTLQCGGGKRKGRVMTRPVGTSLRVGVSQNVSQSYFGCVACGFGAAGVVVAGLVPGAAAGLDAAGLTGAGTPDCVL